MLRALAIAARIAPGREHEGGRGRRLRSEEGVLIEDDEATIEELARFDATAGVGAAAGAGAGSGASGRLAARCCPGPRRACSGSSGGARGRAGRAATRAWAPRPRARSAE